MARATRDRVEDHQCELLSVESPDRTINVVSRNAEALRRLQQGVEHRTRDGLIVKTRKQDLNNVCQVLVPQLKE
jgi:hypothetical protein